MRKFLALVFGLALFVPLAACGGGDDEDTSSGSSSGSASSADEDEESTTTTEADDDEGDGGGGANADSEYCDNVQAVIDLDDAFGEDEFDFTDEDTLNVVLDALEELRDSVDDDDIADDYDTAIDGFELIAEAVQDAGGDEDAALEVFTDPELADQLQGFEEATTRIDEFTLEQCGQTLDGSTEADGGFEETDDTSSTAGADDEDTSLDDFADDVDACEGGDLEACDTLYSETPFGSEAEAVALECGGEDPGGNHTGDCVESFG